MAGEAQCRPPEGAKLGTLHWLSDPSGRQKLVVRVYGDCWRFADGTLLSDSRAAELGWRYLEPAASLV